MWVRARHWQTLGKRNSIVHINAMSEKHDNPSDKQARAVPQYRARLAEGETRAPKSAENAAATPAADTDATPGTGGEKPTGSNLTPDEAKEIGGPKGLEPTRFGDWERDGRCVDF